MFFSILIPVYNVEKYICECVDSVLSQDEQDYEIVLVDDGSTDSSGIICDEYAKGNPDKIRVIHKHNEGLLMTRRRAIREARGDWFVHLDSDDYMLSGALKKIRQIVTDYDVDLFIGSFIYGQINRNDMSYVASQPFNNFEIFEGESKHNLFMEFLFGGSVTAIWQKIAKRSVVDINSDYTSVSFVSMMEDHLQSMFLLENSNKIIYVNIPIIYYRYNKNSISKKKDVNSQCYCYKSMRTVYGIEADYRIKWSLSNKENACVLAKHFRKLFPVLKEIVKSTTIEGKNLLDIIADDYSLREEFTLADKKIMGKKSFVFFSLVFRKNNKLLKFISNIL